MIATTASQLAAAIKNRRLTLGLTQTELAQRAGIRQKSVSEFETRPEGRSLKTLFRLMSALELEFDIAERPSDTIDDPDRW